MVKNMGKGGSGHKRQKNSSMSVVNTRELMFKTSDQHYATVVKMLGGCRCLCRIHTKNHGEKIGIIRGNMRNRYNSRINVHDVVIVTDRGYQDDKVDIVYVYKNDEVSMLISYNELNHDEYHEDMTSDATYNITNDVIFAH
jgi:initiation factor 1A